MGYESKSFLAQHLKNAESSAIAKNFSASILNPRQKEDVMQSPWPNTIKSETIKTEFGQSRLLNQSGREIVFPRKMTRNDQENTAINPIFGYSEGAVKMEKTKGLYVKEAKADICKLAMTDSPIIAKR